MLKRWICKTCSPGCMVVCCLSEKTHGCLGEVPTGVPDHAYWESEDHPKDLTEYLETHEPGEFKSGVQYFPVGDYFTFYLSDERCYSERMDSLLTIFRSIPESLSAERTRSLMTHGRSAAGRPKHSMNHSETNPSPSVCRTRCTRSIESLTPSRIDFNM